MLPSELYVHSESNSTWRRVKFDSFFVDQDFRIAPYLLRPGEELAPLPVREVGEDMGQILIRIQSVCLRRLDDGRQHGGGLSPIRGLAEEDASPVGREHLIGLLSGVVVYRDGAALQKGEEVILSIQIVSDCIPEGRTLVIGHVGDGILERIDLPYLC